MADRYAKAAADHSAPYRDEATPKELIYEATLSYMTRTATAARSRATAEWIKDNVRAERWYRPPPGRGMRRQHLRNTRKELAGRFYQSLAGHASIGPYLRRVGTIDDDKCWCCNTGERQTRFHLVARCPRWRGQARVLWKRVDKLCEQKKPRAPAVKLLFDDVRAAPAVLSFLQDTQIGRIVPQALRRRREGEDGREVDREGEEPAFSFISPLSWCDNFGCAFLWPFLFVLSFVSAFRCEGGPTLAGNGLWSRKTGLLEKPTTAAWAAG